MALPVLSVPAFAAQEPVTLDISKGSIEIQADGYRANGNAGKTAYTGSYRIIGTTATNTLKISGQAEESTITLEGVKIQAVDQTGCTIRDAEISLAGDGLSVSGSSSTTSGTSSSSGYAAMELNGDAVEILGTGALTVTQSGVAEAVLTAADTTICTDGEVVLNGGFGCGIRAQSSCDLSIQSKQDRIKISGISSAVSINGDVALQAKQELLISSDGAAISANGDASLISETGAITFDGMLGSKALGTVVAAGGDLTMQAVKDITALSVAAGVSAGGDLTVISSSGSIDIEGNQSPALAAGGSAVARAAGDIKVDSTNNLGFNASKNITIDAGGAVTLHGGKGQAMQGGEIAVTAKDGISAISDTYQGILSGESVSLSCPTGPVEVRCDKAEYPAIQAGDDGTVTMTGNKLTLNAMTHVLSLEAQGEPITYSVAGATPAEDSIILPSLTRADGVSLASWTDGTTICAPGEAYAVRADAVLTPVWQGDLPFVDVPKNQWYYDHVKYVYENGIMSGTSATTFEPNGTMNRAMAVTILNNLSKNQHDKFGLEAEHPASFSDVPEGKWYTDPVKWAGGAGVVAGYADGTFHPMDNVTREQFAQILYNYAGQLGFDTTARADLSGFTDASKISSWATDAMQWAVGSGIMSGMGDNTLNPKGTLNRAQAAAMMRSFINNVHE